MAAGRGDRARNEAKRPSRQPRVPVRGRGVARYGALLDAAETLLLEQSPDDVGLYDIAEAAGIPPASVYHFFPTKEAAFVGLVQRYTDGFKTISREPFPAKRLRSWQDLMRIEQEYARAYYGAHPVALKLFFGGLGGLEGRRLDHQFNSAMAQGMYGRYDTVFHMPHVAEPARRFNVGLSIMDAIWSLSFHETGSITHWYGEEALAACFAYCRLFLPEQVEVRAHVRDLAAQDQKITLPLD